MPTDDTCRSLQWLAGIALIDAAEPLPMLACASKSALRIVGRAIGVGDETVPFGTGAVGRRRPGLRMIFNDDHGMAPSVTIVNQTSAPVVLQGVLPSVLSTDNGTYDLEALLASGPRRIEPGRPLVIHIKDIGRNAGEPYRVGDTSSARHEGEGSRRGVSRAASPADFRQRSDVFGEPVGTPIPFEEPSASNDQSV